ncbi:MAG: hypothetical protein ACE5Q3_09940 [Alphaproteobacteria bacterium]
MTELLEKALLDPTAVFTSPEEVLARADLSKSQKRLVLRRWLEDAIALSVAEEEGMVGGEPSLIERVCEALSTLDRDARSA